MSISRSKWLSDVRGDRYEEESWILDIHCDLPEIDHIELFRLQFEKKKNPFEKRLHTLATRTGAGKHRREGWLKWSWW